MFSNNKKFSRSGYQVSGMMLVQHTKQKLVMQNKIHILLHDQHHPQHNYLLIPKIFCFQIYLISFYHSRKTLFGTWQIPKPCYLIVLS